MERANGEHNKRVDAPDVCHAIDGDWTIIQLLDGNFDDRLQKAIHHIEKLIK